MIESHFRICATILHRATPGHVIVQAKRVEMVPEGEHCSVRYCALLYCTVLYSNRCRDKLEYTSVLRLCLLKTN